MRVRDFISLPLFYLKHTYTHLAWAFASSCFSISHASLSHSPVSSFSLILSLIHTLSLTLLLSFLLYLLSILSSPLPLIIFLYLLTPSLLSFFPYFLLFPVFLFLLPSSTIPFTSNTHFTTTCQLPLSIFQFLHPSHTCSHISISLLHILQTLFFFFFQ